MEPSSQLILKYNRPAPRYTSYPPVPYWTERPTEEQWLNHLRSSYQGSMGVDLYVHVPYCESLCAYCGCNRTITKNHSVEEPYVQILLKEWDLYKQKLGVTPKVHSLHFGGGTPTFLSAGNLARLLDALLENKSDLFIGSVEIDPRTVKDDHLDVFKHYGLSRISLGIQDFNQDVQRAIHRIQPPDLVREVTSRLRERNFASVNFDLIYGLPRQRVETIEETFAIVGELRPDLIAFYSYAHLPEKIKNQKLIKEAELPTPEVKRALYLAGKRIVEEQGYTEIGMDHFALPGSSLHRAMSEKTLHRNFMGYVDKKSNVLIGLGPSSISDSSVSFIQNAKDLSTYTALVKQGQLPFVEGHTHTREDLIVQQVILDLMCQHEVWLEHKQDIPGWDEIQKDLHLFIEDGLLELAGDRLTIKPEGKSFVRNIALSFDFHYRKRQNQARFSLSI